MTPSQNKLYWAEWRSAKAVADLDESDRYAIHAELFGEEKSSRDLTTEEFDQVLAKFRAISDPDNVNAQLTQQAQPAIRLLHSILTQVKALQSAGVDHPWEYVSHICKRTGLHNGFLHELQRYQFACDNPQPAEAMRPQQILSAIPNCPSIRELTNLRNTLTARARAKQRDQKKSLAPSPF